MEETGLSKSGAIVRVGVFLFLAFTGQLILPWLILPFGLLVAAALGTFASAALATLLCLRMFERSPLADVGLRWHASALKNVGTGLCIGIGAALLVTVVPCLLRMAEYQSHPETPFQLSSILFVSVILVFGVIGEEILFRGYGFQLLAGTFGEYQSLLPVSVLFAAVHAGNPNSTSLSLFITFLWGVLLGFAFLRSGDLWLPIAIHFGWNVTLPLAGVQLSGFTMGLTGYNLVWKASDLWSGGTYGPEGGLVTLLVIPLVFYAIYRAPLERQTPFLMQNLYSQIKEE